MYLRPVFAALVVLLGLVAPTLAAEVRHEPKAVLELFTSQGCSSCPAADALLADFGKQQDIIALAYHVDYWDYIGWPDTFGAKAHSDHQRAYAESWGSSRIFTPQLIVNGAEGVVGSRRQEISVAMGNGELPLPIGLARHGDMLKISIGPRRDLEEAVVWLVTFIDRADVVIERGENSGKKIAYTNIVTGRQLLGMWEPQTGAALKLPLGEVLAGRTNGVAVIVQEDRDGLPGPILGAASLQL